MLRSGGAPALPGRSATRMQIAVISDLHLGRKNALDRFARAREAEARLLRLLDHLQRSVDRIVLLGDIFETLRGLVPGPLEQELRAAMAAYPELTRRALDDPRYQLVHGNHDIVAGRTLGAPEFHVIEDRGTKMVFFHGHQMDRLAKGKAPFSRLGVWLGGVLERIGVQVTQRVDAAVHAKSHREREEEEAMGDATIEDLDAFQHAAVRLGRELGADIVINGHTHHAVRREIDGQLYLNSGTCLSGRHEMVLIDTRAHSYEILIEPAFA